MNTASTATAAVTAAVTGAVETAAVTTAPAPHPALLAPGILRIVAGTTVARGATAAVAGGRDVTADDPRALRAALASELYRRHHMGRTDEEPAAPRELRDTALEARLLDAMPHRRLTRVVEQAGEGDDRHVPVVLDGVRVLMDRERVDTTRIRTDGRLRVHLDAARPAVSPGFFLCEGTVPARGRSTGTLRVYLHVTGPDAAPAVWSAVLGLLEAEQLPYRAKIASSRNGYPRQDACVVYLGAESWGAAELLADTARGLPGLGGTVSDFVRELAPGVGAAWEPADDRPGMRRVSFGEHRAAAVASGLVAHAEDPTARSLHQAVHDSLRDAGIDPADPAHNATSPRSVLPPPATAAGHARPYDDAAPPLLTGLPQPFAAAGR
ncbi:T3SS effector HopA1 family protein [Streptomyces sp. NPDC047028]|uniref:T3SS effector HopA1 family protein n=1 Tax=Streptomyces sp. NPDC047028 TaxID=3155793 RepID=UPI0033D81EA8